MGLDLLHIKYAMNARFHRGCDLDDLSPVFGTHTPADVSAGELFEFVVRQPGRCGTCEYDLRGHSKQGRCPECGQEFDLSIQWTEFVTVLADVLRCKAESIKADSLLVQDLGMC